MIAEVSTTLEMRPQNLVDCLPSKNPRIPYVPFIEGSFQQGPQGGAQPMMRRDVEALFAPRKHGARKLVLHHIPQDKLERSAANLKVLRQRGGEFDDAVIEERGAHCERMGHAHAVAFI